MNFNNLEKIVKASQETLNQFLITQLPINIFLVDTDGCICWANKNLLNFVNINSLEDVIGIHISHWDKCRWDAIQEVLETKQETNAEEFYNGTFFSSIRKPVIRNNKLIGVLGLSIDITEKKQSEIAKQQFIMNMAHDLRTPLSGIIGLSSIQAIDGTTVQDREHGQWIQDASNQLLELLNSVLEVIMAEYHTGSIAKDTIHFQQFAEELHALMLPAVVTKELDFKINLDVHLPLIITDRIKLKRLVLNLLANAIKFTKKGKVNLEIKLVSIKENQAKVEILVTDTGIGIAADKLDKIFDRFYRVHPSYKTEYTGYGIGLFLVKKALEQLGGEIKVSSEEEKGSCFTLIFNFPLAEEIKEPTSSVILQEPALQHEIDNRKKSVLVAEDNQIVLYAIKNILTKLGYEVTAVTKGKAALQVLQKQSFDWVLLDIGLPDLKGIEVAKAYRHWEKEHNKIRLPLFALTAHTINEIEEECEMAGFDYIFNKPFTIKEVKIIKNKL